MHPEIESNVSVEIARFCAEFGTNINAYIDNHGNHISQLQAEKVNSIPVNPKHMYFTDSQGDTYRLYRERLFSIKINEQID